MIKLNEALAEYTETITFGGADDASSDKARLRRRLRLIQKHNERYFLIALACMVSAFIAILVLGIVHAQLGSMVLAGLCLGGTVTYLVKLMLNAWQEKVTIEIVLELTILDDTIVKQVAATLLEGRRKGWNTAQPIDASRDNRRAELREAIGQHLVGDADLDAFCSDHYSKIYKKFTIGMSRTEKVTMLLDYTGCEELQQTLGRAIASRSSPIDG